METLPDNVHRVVFEDGRMDGQSLVLDRETAAIWFQTVPGTAQVELYEPTTRANDEGHQIWRLARPSFCPDCHMPFGKHNHECRLNAAYQLTQWGHELTLPDTEPDAPTSPDTPDPT